MQGHIATPGWEHLHRLPYSPGLPPRDFNLCATLKKNLAGKRFEAILKSNKSLNDSSVYKALSFPWSIF
ncbi:hypothetical protein TNCV_3122961 [Trichonephila clavipes]|nr:hypothetical protein TNCV_3122961 [Trichonephila clavipes]